MEPDVVYHEDDVLTVDGDAAHQFSAALEIGAEQPLHLVCEGLLRRCQLSGCGFRFRFPG